MKDSSQLKIVVKARQTGYSFCAALRAVLECSRRKTTWIFLSKGERQSRLLMEKVCEHVQGIGMAAPLIEHDFTEGVTVKQLEVRFPNGSVIYGLPANPETARGFSGNVTLDEFAFHRDAEKIYTALYPSITRGYSLEIISTPNGQNGKFYELAKAAGLVGGGLALPSAWSAHRVTLWEAFEQGLKVDVAALRSGVDDETWQQEYCCEFISTASQWIGPELWQSCVSSEATSEFGMRNSESATRVATGDLYAGWDIARKRDLSVIWIAELVGDVTWTRGIITFRNMPTPDQVKEARALLPRLRRMTIDMSGMGLAIFEQLAREFPGKVEGVSFTQPVKEAMAVRVKDRMEKRLMRLPDSDEARAGFMSLKRAVTSTGLARFDAEHDSRYGHADHFWACALAEAAAERPSCGWSECAAVFGKPLGLGVQMPVDLMPQFPGEAR